MCNRKDGAGGLIIKKGVEAVINLVFPRRCPVCDRPAGYGRLICPGCIGKLKVVKGAVCCKCGKPLVDESAELCSGCRGTKHQYKEGRSLYEYKSVNRSIYRFKYSGRSEYGDYFGKAMAHYLGKTIKEWDPDIIVPVPLHEKKLRKRGFNQSAVLAKSLSKELGIPYSDRLIKRVRNTVPMKELDARKRQINLKNAFIVGSYDVKLRKVVIVDDIYTTGSTVDAMAVAFSRAGVSDVYFVALSTGAPV